MFKVLSICIKGLSSTVPWDFSKGERRVSDSIDHMRLGREGTRKIYSFAQGFSGLILSIPTYPSLFLESSMKERGTKRYQINGDPQGLRESKTCHGKLKLAKGKYILLPLLIFYEAIQ